MYVPTNTTGVIIVEEFGVAHINCAAEGESTKEIIELIIMTLLKIKLQQRLMVRRKLLKKLIAEIIMVFRLGKNRKSRPYGSRKGLRVTPPTVKLQWDEVRRLSLFLIHMRMLQHYWAYQVKKLLKRLLIVPGLQEHGRVENGMSMFHKLLLEVVHCMVVSRQERRTEANLLDLPNRVS
ncbi:hypothetical protein HAX54_034045 [Datura stramonium]|uniref:Uncharacterized protein n=1 Tax=Datura stramonium TaxID=4076 RepID=A0ABS8SDU2_DATST|nr:hypothetical protein [Datura stramonium]